MALAPDDPRHGTVNGYNNLKCRCQPCRNAWSANHLDYMRRNPTQYARQARREAFQRDPTGEKAAARAEKRAERARREEEAMRKRRLRAETRAMVLDLHAEGWSYNQIIAELKKLGLPGYRHAGTISNLVNGDNP